MEENYKIQKYENFAKFYDKLKALKKHEKKKKRQNILNFFSKYLANYQVLTHIKFHPKLYVQSDEILNYYKKFEEPNYEPYKQHKIITLPKFENKLGEETAFFANNNLNLLHHISIPIKHNFDLNFDAIMSTKNNYLFYNFNTYSTFYINDFKFKVFLIVFQKNKKL